MRHLVILAGLCLMLAACAGSLVTATPVCLPLKPYTAAEQAAQGASLAKLPADDPLVGLVLDYGAMRDADRACQQALPH